MNFRFTLSPVVERPGNEDHTSKGPRVTHPTVFPDAFTSPAFGCGQKLFRESCYSYNVGLLLLLPQDTVLQQQLRDSSQKPQTLAPALVLANCRSLDTLLSPSQLQFHHQDKCVWV